MVSKKHEPDYDLDEDRLVHLTYEEALVMFDEAAQYYLNMSGEEFLRRWKANDFEDPDSAEVVHVGIMAPMFIEK